MQKNKLRIISRNSQLALWQARHVENELKKHYPDLSIEIIGITTEGDRILDKSLDKIGGKGLFIKELEQQLLEGNADIAVHSLKDLPANLIPDFKLAAILPREIPNDAFISNRFSSLDSMPAGSVIGTSSARRQAILAKYYPHLEVKLLRGNLQTRLAKLDNGDYDGIILAVAGLKRLGLDSRIRQVLPLDKFIPAIGQGVLAIEVCSHRVDLLSIVEVLHDPVTAMEIGAERETGRYMNASCNIPIACYAEIIGSQLNLTAMIADNQESSYLTAQTSGSSSQWLELGQNCANILLDQGAADIVAKYSVL